MFLSWISKCELVKSQDDSHILKAFSPECSRDICYTTISYLTSIDAGQDIRDMLSSATHIKWAMEILGHAFALRMEDYDIIKGTIEIYEKWLRIDRRIDMRPPCILHVEQGFIQEMLGHLSLLFEDRGGKDASSIEQHISLCQRVLDLYLAVGRVRGSELDAYTWERLLRLMIGISDSVLHPKSRSVIGSKIASRLFRITIELFLRSLTITGPSGGGPWNVLLAFSRRWVHSRAVVEQWNAVTFALTEKIMLNLYHHDSVDRKERQVLSIHWADGYKTKLSLQETSISYAWYTILQIIGNPAILTKSSLDGVVHMILINGIGTLLNSFLSAGGEGELPVLSPPSSSTCASVEKSNGSFMLSRPANPDSNAILRVLGPWLFDAVLNRDSRNYSNGKARAFEILGKLLCDSGGGNSKKLFEPHATRFIQAIIKGLQETEASVVTVSILCNCWGIFGANGVYTLCGHELLAGYFFKAVERTVKSIFRYVFTLKMN